MVANGITKGRLLVVFSAAVALWKALVTAIRWTAVRRQFSPETVEEAAVLDYPLTRYRLMPQLAKAVACFRGYRLVIELYPGFLESVASDADSSVAAEFHALLSIFKPLAGWYGVEGI